MRAAGFTPARPSRRLARVGVALCLSVGLLGPLAAGSAVATGSSGATASVAAALPATENPSPTPGITAPVGTAQRGGPELAKTGVILYDRPAGVPRPPGFAAGAYLVADLNSGDVLLSFNAYVQSLPASTIKTLTALALVPVLDPAQVIKAVPQDAAVDGTKVGMEPGASYTVDQLFHALMMSSANDAAVALARAAGGEAAATARMNQVLADLGALDSRAANTSGLDAVGQVTTVYDMALIGRAAVRDAKVRQYATTRTFDFPDGLTKRGQPERGQYQISNHNRLLWNYDGTIGVKNGYTIKARQTYIGAVQRGDQAYVITYLAGEGGGWRATADLMDWVFEYGPQLKPVGALTQPTPSTTDATHVAVAGDTSAGSSGRVDAAAVGTQSDGSDGPRPLTVILGVVTALAAAVVGLRIRAVRRTRARRRLTSRR